jgi:SAM-dependent methyltransferase
MRRPGIAGRRCRTALFLFLLPVAGLQPAGGAADTTAVGRLRAEADSLRPLARSPLGRAFLAATAELPSVKPRAVWRDSSRTRAWSEAEARALPDSARARLVRRELDEAFYWNTRYGTPLAYLRAIEVLAEHGLADLRGRRIADFGCGTVGHLRLLASLGADATGIDVDPLLRALYAEPGDLGQVGEGRVRLVVGRWPGEPRMRDEVGERLDLFLSKNTLKRGYIHPAEPVDSRMLVQLGVEDSVFVSELFRVLRPGGRMLIYNLSPVPAPPGKPYLPWADGRCPFPEALWRAAGFHVLAFDRDDSPAARAMGHALGWDRGGSPMDLERDLFATWSLFEKPAP